MTGTIEDGFHLADDAEPLPQDEPALPQDDDLAIAQDEDLALGQDESLREISQTAALIEQAKGVLIFRYSIGACTAFRLIERWAKEARVGIDVVARTLVHEICQGDRSRPANPRFVRWLESRLRQEFPVEPYEVPRTLPVVKVAVDQSDSSLDAVVEAAREASRRCVPLEVTADAASLQGVQRDQMVQRMRLACELARAVSPGLEVRLPEDVRAPRV